MSDSRSIVWISLSACLLMSAAACDSAYESSDQHSKVNGSIHVAAGQPAESVNTVNGGIHIDDNAAVDSASTVNGGIHLGAHATGKSLHTVNGGIGVEDGAHATDVKSVNGDLDIKDGADVSGEVANVNGKIRINSAHVGGGIKTVNADITITGASHVDGGIYVQKPNSIGFSSGDDPVITIGPGAAVQGELKFERKVVLYVSDHATIGTVTGATPISFSGDTPPSSK